MFSSRLIWQKEGVCPLLELHCPHLIPNLVSVFRICLVMAEWGCPSPPSHSPGPDRINNPPHRNRRGVGNQIVTRFNQVSQVFEYIVSSRKTVEDLSVGTVRNQSIHTSPSSRIPCHPADIDRSITAVLYDSICLHQWGPTALFDLLWRPVISLVHIPELLLGTPS